MNLFDLSFLTLALFFIATIFINLASQYKHTLMDTPNRTYRNHSNISFGPTPLQQQPNNESYRSHSQVGGLMSDRPNDPSESKPQQTYHYQNKYPQIYEELCRGNMIFPSPIIMIPSSKKITKNMGDTLANAISL